jgi:hypothetical protein
MHSGVYSPGMPVGAGLRKLNNSTSPKIQDRAWFYVYIDVIKLWKDKNGRKYLETQQSKMSELGLAWKLLYPGPK